MDYENIQNGNNAFALLSKYRGAVMGIAAICILYFHEWIPLTATPPEGTFHLFHFLEEYTHRIFFFGVDIFLLLSGIGLTFAIRKESLLRFYCRRLRRVLPPFLTVAVIRCCTEKWDAPSFFGNISGFNFYAKSIYSFLWFVPAIITLYLLFPLYDKLFEKANNKVLFTGGVLMVWLLATLLVRDKMRPDLFGFTNRIPVFVIGILFGYLTQRRAAFVLTLRNCLFLLVALFLGLYLAYLANFRGVGLIVPVGNCCLPNCLIAVSLPFLIAKLLDVMERRLSRFGRIVVKILSFFGSFSLEFYCVQEWFANVMIPKLREHGLSDFLINIVLFLMVTVIAWSVSVLFNSFLRLFEGKKNHNQIGKTI
jgi:peptidoglycan/LPS O-acetylase OafA/YrhL